MRLNRSNAHVLGSCSIGWVQLGFSDDIDAKERFSNLSYLHADGDALIAELFEEAIAGEQDLLDLDVILAHWWNSF